MDEISRDQRLRGYTLVPLTVLGIVLGAVLGLAFALGGIGEGAATARNPAGLIFFVLPPAVCMGLGWISYRVARAIAR